MLDAIIVGGGPGGISALIWCHRLGLKTLLLEAREELGGQLFSVNNPIIDYPGIPVANGRELQQKFLNHVKELGCPYECGVKVESFHLREGRLETNKGIYQAKAIILALGSRDRRLEIPGEAEMIARKEVYSASRDKEKFNGKKVAVIGGGDRAVEGALLLAEHGAHVTLIHRSDSFRARKDYLEPVREHPGIQVVTHSFCKEIVGKDRVQGIVVAPINGNGGQEQFLPVEAVFVRIGVTPNSDLIREQVDLDEEGYVLVDSMGKTKIPNVFAIGDLCTRPLFSSVAGSVAQGMRAAKRLSYQIETGEGSV